MNFTLRITCEDEDESTWRITLEDEDDSTRYSNVFIDGDLIGHVEKYTHGATRFFPSSYGEIPSRLHLPRFKAADEVACIKRIISEWAKRQQ